MRGIRWLAGTNILDKLDLRCLFAIYPQRIHAHFSNSLFLEKHKKDSIEISDIAFRILLLHFAFSNIHSPFPVVALFDFLLLTFYLF